MLRKIQEILMITFILACISISAFATIGAFLFQMVVNEGLKYFPDF